MSVTYFRKEREEGYIFGLSALPGKQSTTEWYQSHWLQHENLKGLSPCILEQHQTFPQLELPWTLLAIIGDVLEKLY